MSIEIKYNYLKDLMDKIFRSEHLYDFVVEAGADRQKYFLLIIIINFR